MASGTVPLLQIDDIRVTFDGVVALDGTSFQVRDGQVCGLIGPNGAGKTTLFNCVSRIYRPNRGRIAFAGTDVLSVPPHRITALGIARTFQNLGLFPRQSVLENVMVGAHHRTRADFLTGALALRWARREERDLRAECTEILRDLDLIAYANHPAEGLPFGTLKRIEIARALATRPRLLMMDEPASGLAHAEVDELADLILRLRGGYGLTVLLVEHHMNLVMSISDRVVALDFGRKLADGTPAEVQRDPAVIAAYLGRGNDADGAAGGDDRLRSEDAS